MSVRRRALKPRVFSAVGLLVAACSGAVEPVVVLPPTGPVSRDELIGTYDAVEFTTTAGEDVIDLLALGASLTLTMESSAHYSGQVSAPGIGAGGADVDEMLEGAWTFDIVTHTTRFPAGSPLLDATFRPSRSEDVSTLLEFDQSLRRHFLTTRVEEPSIDKARVILRAWGQARRETRGQEYSTGAIEQALLLSHRFLARDRLPRKAVDLLDESAMMVGDDSRITEKQVLDRFFSN